VCFEYCWLEKLQIDILDLSGKLSQVKLMVGKYLSTFNRCKVLYVLVQKDIARAGASVAKAQGPIL
jgi:hypothetical protein